jgi:diguanylate cyclase (GGDEF)-like protein
MDITNLLVNFEKQSQPIRVMTGFTLIAVIGLIDYVTGHELALLELYIFPVALITWCINRGFGFWAAIISTFVWLFADVSAGIQFSQPFIPIWNTFIRMGLFLMITWLFSILKESMNHEKELARIDYLTGAANSRYFKELLQMEIDRYQRYGHPFTLAYIDLDNFKSVNDRFGHSTGDQVLRVIANSAQKHLRKTDVIARLGGDEFALLLPETGPAFACSAIAKIQGYLLEEMQRNNWPVTFSIGVLTCESSPRTPDELVRITDELMYSVKRASKNAVKYALYAG